MGLDPAGAADLRIPLYFHKRTNKGIAPDGAAVQIDRLHYSYFFAKNRIGRNPGLFNIDIHASLALE